MRLILSFVIAFSCTLKLVANVRIYRFDRAIIFGDSLTDNGNNYNLTNHTWPISPPYYQGRFSDGPIWVDRLNISEKTDYAYGGATTDTTYAQGYTKLDTVPVPGVRQQVAAYVRSASSSTTNFARTVYIIWMGGNDFLYNMNATPQGYVNSSMNVVRDLIAFGAQNFLIFNQVPAQAFPYINRLNSTALYTALTNQVNSVLTSSLDAMQRTYSNVALQRFDVNALFSKALANQSYPFANTVDGCWDAVNLTTVGKFCSDPLQYFFIDSFHVTSPVHQLIANEVYVALSYNNGIVKSASFGVLLLALLMVMG